MEIFPNYPRFDGCHRAFLLVILLKLSTKNDKKTVRSVKLKILSVVIFHLFGKLSIPAPPRYSVESAWPCSYGVLRKRAYSWKPRSNQYNFTTWRERETKSARTHRMAPWLSSTKNEYSQCSLLTRSDRNVLTRELIACTSLCWSSCSLFILSEYTPAPSF